MNLHSNEYNISLAAMAMALESIRLYVADQEEGGGVT